MVITELCLYWVCPDTVKKELRDFDISVSNILKLFYKKPYTQILVVLQP